MYIINVYPIEYQKIYFHGGLYQMTMLIYTAMSNERSQEQFEDAKGVTRNCKSKNDWHDDGQYENNKKTQDTMVDKTQNTIQQELNL